MAKHPPKATDPLHNGALVLRGQADALARLMQVTADVLLADPIELSLQACLLYELAGRVRRLSDMVQEMWQQADAEKEQVEDYYRVNRCRGDLDELFAGPDETEGDDEDEAT
jgi:hypothetical protein